LEHTPVLLQCMQAVDTLSHTNRLKRAGLRGVDVPHLSRNTVTGILANVGKQLRNASVQDEELPVCAGQRDVLTLLGVLRKMFGALEEMRVLLTEVVLDPGSAAHVSKVAMDPTKVMCVGGETRRACEWKGRGWMALMSNLFAGSLARRGGRGAGARSDDESPLVAPRPPSQFVLKLELVLAVSATTVKIEFPVWVQGWVLDNEHS
ncbi:hypothetical protein K438DRAFT_1620501, partial [Mycena galopus ATCC 62051]